MADHHSPVPSSAPARASEKPGTRLLTVRSLAVHYRGARRPAVEALRGVDLEVEHGEVLGILGESGSGKSTLAVALTGLLPPNARLTAGQVLFAGRDLLGLDEASLERLRGDRLSIVFQEPGLALNPVLRVGTQITDVLRAHRKVSTAEARQQALGLLGTVRFEEPGSIFAAYPHQLSGGEQQRVAIAQAIICQPDLLIADEPTAALDTVTQASLVRLIARLRSELDMAVIFVSHDPALLAGLADRLLVMYAGKIVESGPSARLFAAPMHPYPAELLRCVPAPTERREVPLHVIPGAPPRLDPPPPGCAFEPRCSRRLERCAGEVPELTGHGPARAVACWNHLEAAD